MVTRTSECPRSCAIVNASHDTTLSPRSITKRQTRGWITDLDAADRNLPDDFLFAAVSMHVHGCDRAHRNEFKALAALYDRLHDDTRVRRFVGDVSGWTVARI